MKIGFLEEQQGQKSTTRLIAVMFACYAIVASAYLFYKNSVDYAGGIAVFTSIAGIAIGLKLVQKPMENKTSDNQNTTI